MLDELANKATSITGGADGLQGMDVWPVFGASASICSAAPPMLLPGVLFLVLAAWRDRSSIRRSAARSPASARTCGACMRSARRCTAALIDLHDLGGAGRHFRRADRADDAIRRRSACSSFDRSGTVLIMLIIGGVGRLYGAFIGVPLYMIAQDRFAEIDPVYWYFWIGLFMVLVVVFARGGVLGLIDAVRGASRQAHMSDAALETRGCARASARCTVANDIDFRLEPGARHALIGPNGAGKTSFVNLVTGVLAPSGGRILLGGERHHRTRAGRARQARAGAHLPDQHAVPRPDRARERHAGGRRAATASPATCIRPAGRYRAGLIEEAYALLERLGSPTKRCDRSTSSPMAASGWSRSRSRSASNPRCCCSTSRPPACPRARAAPSST